MTDGESHATRNQSTADSENRATRNQSMTEFTLASLFAVVLFAQILGLVIVHSYILFETGGPSTFDTLRTVWIGGIVLTGGLLVVELLS